MWQLKSKKTGKVQFLTNDEFDMVKARGWLPRYTYQKMPEKKMLVPPVIKPEPVTKKTTKKTDKHD